MPNIVLPSGEVVYRPMSDSVWSVLSELSAGGVNEAAIFNGKKLAMTADFAKIPHLTDQAKIYIVRKSGAVPTPPAGIDPAELHKYKQIYNEMTEDEIHLVHESIGSITGIHRQVIRHPILRTDNVGLDLLRNFSLFSELIFTGKLPSTHTYLFQIFVRSVEHILSRRRLFQFGAGLVNPPSSSSGAQADGQPARTAQTAAAQPSYAVPPPITSQMLRQALNMFAVPPPPIPVAGGAPAAPTPAAPAAQPEPPAPVAVESMEVGPDYTQLRQMYGVQLAQMRDFGFVDDEENMRTLQACDGILERALELLITIRESEPS